MSGNYDSTLKSRIQQATDIVELISEHLSLERKGREFVGLCPFHQDHRPSLYVNPEKQIFKCFACGAGGDVFKFVQMRENLSFPEAIERLGHRAGIEVRAADKRVSEGVSGKDLARVNAWACEYWKRQLADDQVGQTAREYVASRKLEVESVDKWQIGLALDNWDGLVQQARKQKISNELLVAAGLAVQRSDGSLYDKFRNRLMFPIADVTNRVIGFGGRTLGDDPAKYMNSPASVLFDKSNCVYGIDQARHAIVSSNTAVVVEGYTDVIMAHQFGVENVVATLGTSFTAGHARLLRRYAKAVILVFDNDVAGVEAANRALETCLTEGLDIRLAFVPAGKDPCDFILEKGRAAFERVLSDAVDVIEFKWSRLQEELTSGASIMDQRSAAEEFLRTIAAALAGGRLDALGRGIIIRKVSSVMGLGREEIGRELERLSRMQKRAMEHRRSEGTTRENSRRLDLRMKAQRETLEVLFAKPELYEMCRNRIDFDSFEPVLREVSDALRPLLEEGQRPSVAEVLANIESERAGAEAVELAERGQIKGHEVQRLKDAIRILDVPSSPEQRQLDTDETEALRKIQNGLRRRNRRNPGMISN